MFCNIPGMSQPKDAPALATEMDKLAAKLTEMGIQFEDRQIYLTRGRQIAVYEKGRKVWMLFAARFPTAASADCWRSRALSWTENARTARRKAGRPPIMLSRW